MNKLIVIEGTTAAGKSDIGIRLARQFDGEVISADSRQVFRGLDLGSGKVTKEEQQMVPHHLIDVCEPGDFFSMADFQKLAYDAIEDVIARGKVPFLVGGTGLYVDSVAEGYQLSGKMPDLGYRAELEKLTTPQLYDMLMEKLPGYEVDAKTATGSCGCWKSSTTAMTPCPPNAPGTTYCAWASPGNGKC